MCECRKPEMAWLGINTRLRSRPRVSVRPRWGRKAETVWLRTDTRHKTSGTEKRI